MVASSPGLDHRTTGGELPEEHLSSSEHERRESPERKVTHSGTWRFRSFLLQVGIFMPVLGIAVGVGGVTTDAWYVLGATLCWILLGVLALRLLKRLSMDSGEVHVVQRGRWAAIGAGLFLLGALFVIAGNLLTS
jgi:hypothetical protein